MAKTTSQAWLARLWSNNLIIAGFLFLLVLAGKFLVLNTPYHWDELGAYIAPAHWLAQGSLVRAWPGLHPAGTFFGHPPALYLTLAVLFKIFGESIFLSHLLILVFSFLGVYFTYLLGSLIFNRLTGFLAALFLFLTPLYFAQSGMFLGDIPIAAFGVMSVYYFLKKKSLAFLFCSLYLVLLKESSIGLILAVLIYLSLTERKDPAFLAKISRLAAPFLVILIFFVWQKIVTGHFLPNFYLPNNRLFDLHPTMILSKLRYFCAWTFWDQSRSVLTCLIFLNAFIYKTSAWKKEMNLFFLILLIFAVIFSFVYFLPRYILIILPYFCIMGAWSVDLLAPDLRIKCLLIAIVLFLFVSGFYGPGRGSGSFETDMQYLDVVTSFRQASQYLESNFPGKKILAGWPLSSILQQPYLGYVKKSLPTAGFNENFDLALYTPHGNEEQQEIKELIEKKNLPCWRRFEKNGKYTEIYLNKPFKN